MANQPSPRKYPCKDVEVLTVSSNIIETAQANLETIVAKRPSWADPFFPNLKTRVDTAFQSYLGIDNAADMRSKTGILEEIMTPALTDLSAFKINIEADFQDNKSRLNEIETTLGFKLH